MNVQDRREFLKGALRFGAVVGLTALGVLLGRRGASACTPSAACRACRVSDTCAIRREKGGRP
jgi:hypothetical protein